MNEKQKRFAFEYVKDYNGQQAAIRAGYSEETAAYQASRLLKIEGVAALIAEKQEEHAAAAMLEVTWVLKQWIDIASADPNDLIKHITLNCRNCWGLGHQYQWTDSQYVDAVNTALNNDKPAPDCLGGFGFDRNRAPNPKCPECGGRGHGEIHIADTRYLTGPAKKLYAGIKQTANGIQVLMRDQDAALQNISRYLGMLADRMELSGPNKGAIKTESTFDASGLPTDVLRLIVEAKKNGKSK